MLESLHSVSMAVVHYTQLTPQFFNNVLQPGDLNVLHAVADNPDLIRAMESIIGYSKTRVAAAITAEVVKTFNNHGICIFGTSVKDAKVLIPRFLDEHPECRDSVPIRCFNKILYYLAWKWHLQNSQQAIKVEEIE